AGRPPALLTVGFSHNMSMLLNGSGLLASPAVSVNFRSLSGRRLPIHDLAKPVELRFKKGSQELLNSQRARCKFWDEAANVWAQEGIRRSLLPQHAEDFVCLTTHLTIFGAVLEAVWLVLQCSTASEVLSVDGLQNLATSHWLHYAATIVTFVSFGLFAGAMIWAMRRDCRMAEDLPPEEVAEALLVSRRSETSQKGLEPEMEAEEAEIQAAPNRCCRCSPRCPRCAACAMKGLDGVFWLVSTMFEVQATDSVSELFDAKTAMVNRCITSIHAYRTGACRQSIRAVMASSGEKKLRRPSTQGEVTHTKTTSSVVSAMHTWNVHYHGVRSVEKFLHGSWLRRVIILLPCMHPWLTASLQSLFRSHTVRVALIVLKLVSATFTNAMFFTSAAQSPDSDEECAAPQTLEEQLMTATIVGFLSACAGDMLIVILALIQRRSVLVREIWTPEMRSRQLFRWRCRQRIFWLIWLVLAGFCALYTLSFLANVSAADAAKWLESTGMSALQDLVFKPVLLAVGYATLSTLVLLCNPRVKDTVTDRWIHPDEVEDDFIADLPSLNFMDRDDTASAGSESLGSLEAEYL
ncbi:rngB, partial [Symbiodinium sp. CCMP2456]